MRKGDHLLDLHRASVTACRRCGHPSDVKPIVSIARSPRAMLVGQAPGKVEAAGGAPFSGRAGATLFRWFASVGLDEEMLRSRMYIAAITRCYPGARESGRGDRVPNAEERANCSPWLSAELQIIRPELLIPVGRLAIEAFLGAQALDLVIGKEHMMTDETQRRLPYDARRTVVIPLPHPSGASSWVHQPGHSRLLRGSLERIAARWNAIMSRRRVA